MSDAGERPRSMTEKLHCENFNLMLEIANVREKLEKATSFVGQEEYHDQLLEKAERLERVKQVSKKYIGSCVDRSHQRQAARIAERESTHDKLKQAAMAFKDKEEEACALRAQLQQVEQARAEDAETIQHLQDLCSQKLFAEVAERLVDTTHGEQRTQVRFVLGLQAVRDMEVPLSPVVELQDSPQQMYSKKIDHLAKQIEAVLQGPSEQTQDEARFESWAPGALTEAKERVISYEELEPSNHTDEARVENVKMANYRNIEALLCAFMDTIQEKTTAYIQQIARLSISSRATQGRMRNSMQQTRGMAKAGVKRSNKPTKANHLRLLKQKAGPLNKNLGTARNTISPKAA